MKTDGIAIVGMSGRFPGAPDIDAYWRNIEEGRDSISRFPIDELETQSVKRPGFDRTGYVGARGVLEDVELFDARFFGYLPRDAELMDPQQRIFLEICWEAIERAGYDAQRYPGAIGVFAGSFMNSYLLANLCSDPRFLAKLVENFQSEALKEELGNDKDYLATHVAFKLGLRGPAMALQTACSTSLVAVATACQSLEAGQCDMALAGGVTIVLPQKRGYRFTPGSILSPDGTCRRFDAAGAGTVFSNGAGVVLLKRLPDALADGDTIHAVIRGHATNNDGNRKVNFTAPSIAGQSEVISRALAKAEVDPRTIGYVEAHGTATPVGDPIEVAALTAAYRAHTQDSGYCTIGSVKANIGHLDVAAGVAGLIKATLAVEKAVLPPSINYSRPNPAIDFAASPFRIDTARAPWPASGWPRRAAVSAFGVGGTNAHVVLEQAPPPVVQHADDDVSGARQRLIVLSARSATALERCAQRLADHVAAHPDVALVDMAFTLQVGRREFDHRRIVVAADHATLADRLRRPALPGDSGMMTALRPQIVFMFPGQGAQYPGMGRELYRDQPVFREVVDRCADALANDGDSGIDLRAFMLFEPGGADAALNERMAREMAQTQVAQPAIFTFEMALAKLLVSWGLKPAALLGHSVGEFAAATLAGVFELEDAVRLVAARGRLMQAQEPGKMIAARLPAAALQPRLPASLAIAAVNAPGMTVVSGPSLQIDAFGALLKDEGVHVSELRTSHAFHSAMMAPAVAPLQARVSATARRESSIPIVSTALGTHANPQTFVDPGYWGSQILKPVLFANALAAAAGAGRRIFLEVGPRRTLTTFAGETLAAKDFLAVVPAQGQTMPQQSESEHLLAAVGKLWVAGARPDWTAMHASKPQRVPLPTYPFERKRFWVEPTATVAVAAGPQETAPADFAPAGTADIGALIHRQLTLMTEQLQALDIAASGPTVAPARAQAIEE